MKIKRITIILIIVFVIFLFVLINGYIVSNIEQMETIVESNGVEESSNEKTEKDNKIVGERNSYVF